MPREGHNFSLSNSSVTTLLYSPTYFPCSSQVWSVSLKVPLWQPFQIAALVDYKHYAQQCQGTRLALKAWNTMSTTDISDGVTHVVNWTAQCHKLCSSIYWAKFNVPPNTL